MTTQTSEKRCQYLPMEVVSNILARLPVNSLIRFKCVCKSWQQLISDHYFRRLHYSHGITQPHDYHNHVALYHCRSEKTFSAIDSSAHVTHVSLAFLNDEVMVRASHNGILCCSSTTDKGIFYVCNPITQEFKELPIAPKLARGRDIYVALACDPSTWTYCVILEGLPADCKNYHVCQMFCSRTNSWQGIVFPLEYVCLNSFWNANSVFLNGKLYSLTVRPHLIALDMTTITWSEIPLPEKDFRVKDLFILEANGSLCLFGKKDGLKMFQYVFLDKENSWLRVKKFRLSTITKKDRFPKYVEPIAQFGFGSLTLVWKADQFFAIRRRTWKTFSQIKHTGGYHPRVYGYSSTLFPCFQ